ncbi:conserved hypothetical protein [Ahrensia sp. R2A130]|nr:conserved hypothetical protein [Ahrensia sp. R2A130]
MQNHDDAPNIPPAIALATPFAIGLKPIDGQPWLVMDEDVEPFRAEKLTLYDTAFHDVNMGRSDTLAAQEEVARLIRDALHLIPASPWKFETYGTATKDGEVRIEANPSHPISAAALLVPDDLLLMRREEDGWRLVAGSLAFPSSWRFKDKFDKTMERIHEPVPIDDRMHSRITRIFDMLRADTPLWRTNWSLDPHYNLREEKGETHTSEKGLPPGGEAYLRTELQTLHKLPESGDILFTVRTKLRQLERLKDNATGRQNLALLCRQFRDMSDEQRRYKGLTADAAQLIGWLKEQVGETA